MKRHDDGLLWDFAAHALDSTEAKEVEAHLADCPDCREQLASVQVACEALELARAARPTVDWQPIDESVGRLVERRLAEQARRPWLKRFVLGIAAVSTVAALAFFTLTHVEPTVAPLPESPPPPVLLTARIDRAQGLSREGVSVFDGAPLAAGDLLETTAGGRAFVHLPDLSHLRLGAASSLTLTRADVDDVALTLGKGHLAVRSSGQDRKAFTVHAGSLSVHSVGNAFVVTHDAQATEIAVAEGRVAVEFVNGINEFVDAGTALRVDHKGRVSRGRRVAPQLKTELDELMAVADATTAVETQSAVVAATGGRASAPPLVAVQGPSRTLPRLDPAQSRARQVQLPPEALGLTPSSSPNVVSPAAQPAEVQTQRLEPTTQLEVEGPPQTRPAGGTEEWALPPQAQAPQPQQAAAPTVVVATPARTEADEWASLPAPAPQSSPARLVDGPVVTATPKPTPRDLESVFLERATAALEGGGCDRYLPGLEELALDGSRGERAERARVLRARCYAAQLRPRQAVNEYRKYLEEHPRGRFAEEAMEALGE